MAASVPVEAKHRQEAKTLGCAPKTNTGGGELCRAREGRGGATYGCLLMLGLSLRLLVAQWSIEVHLCPQEESTMRQGHTQPPWLFCSKLDNCGSTCSCWSRYRRGLVQYAHFPNGHVLQNHSRTSAKTTQPSSRRPQFTRTRGFVFCSHNLSSLQVSAPLPPTPGSRS